MQAHTSRGTHKNKLGLLASAPPPLQSNICIPTNTFTKTWRSRNDKHARTTQHPPVPTILGSRPLSHSFCLIQRRDAAEVSSTSLQPGRCSNCTDYPRRSFAHGGGQRRRRGAEPPSSRFCRGTAGRQWFRGCGLQRSGCAHCCKPVQQRQWPMSRLRHR